MIKETKLDASFPVNEFCINGFSTPYRLDRNRNGGGIIIYVREDITSKMLTKHKFPDDMKHYLLKLIFESASGYFVYYITHLPSLVNTFLII